MNQKKIGEFIAKCRKEKNQTQADLAEKLGVTEKSVSNWENGRNMPDLSLFKSLCENLNITINELMNGEKLSKENNQVNLDENIIKLTELAQLKSMRNGLIGMLICFIILFLISVSKDISPMMLVCLLCSFNSVTYI
ncbi:MAG: helix-turn-helix domain-containing protein, partial [Bacilli bacterium]|nr:helix-turn-helix domain-containing protein [Bacilli bacterium]